MSKPQQKSDEDFLTELYINIYTDNINRFFSNEKYREFISELAEEHSYENHYYALAQLAIEAVNAFYLQLDKKTS